VARTVHAVRGFYRYGVREGLIENDPMENLRAPRAFKALPRFLTTSEVEALLAAPDVAAPLGLRDRAILETLYASGLRVSELIALKPEDVDLDVGLLRCLGKGLKERIVPLARWRGVDPALPQRGARPAGPPLAAAQLFVNHHGGRLSRMGLWGIVRRHAVTAGWRASSRRTCCALVCHASPGARGGPAGSAAMLGTRTSHDADLHARDA